MRSCELLQCNIRFERYSGDDSSWLPARLLPGSSATPHLALLSLSAAYRSAVTTCIGSARRTSEPCVSSCRKQLAAARSAEWRPPKVRLQPRSRPALRQKTDVSQTRHAITRTQIRLALPEQYVVGLAWLLLKNAPTPLTSRETVWHDSSHGKRRQRRPRRNLAG